MSAMRQKTIDPKRKTDERWMEVALAEAVKGLGKTSPNPAVGAVIVKNGRMLAKGFHRAAGSPHAEIEAICSVRNATSLKGAEIFITLEPCCTHGRTPPCTAAILASGFRRVVYGATDPNPKHAGRADAILQAGGVEVLSGVLAERCAEINRAWNHWIVTGRPWVVLKAGMSLDGCITRPGASPWITCPASRKDAMRTRARVDAILIGAETLRKDDPALTVRGIRGARQPLRVVWTRDAAALPGQAKMFTDSHAEKTLVLTCKSFSPVLKDLGKRQITSLLVEGGGVVHGAALDSGLVNEVQFYIAPEIYGGGVPAVGGRGAPDHAVALRLCNMQFERLGRDLKITGFRES